LRGTWTKTAPEGESRLEFAAFRDDERRFLPPIDSQPRALYSPDNLEGVWQVEFTDEDGVQPARGELRQRGDRVEGTFLTPTGDYRYLEGDFRDGNLRLSTFDGAHAFLFTARAHSDGTLTGDFWSRDVYHATWTARRAEEDSEPFLPDAWKLVGLTNDDGRFRFSFPDLDGELVSSTDERFAGRPLLVNIFGSWCPNCNDEAPLLAEWHRRYAGRGLEIVGLAYEFTGDPERDREQVRRYGERHGIEFPLLLAGTSDKGEAAATLPDLTAVIAYPTTVFIGRDGRVRRIHSGFAGPGTGRHHDELVEELESVIDCLLAET
jgi:thiol-disulfide isomerase/thioredoxin